MWQLWIGFFFLRAIIISIIFHCLFGLFISIFLDLICRIYLYCSMQLLSCLMMSSADGYIYGLRNIGKIQAVFNSVLTFTFLWALPGHPCICTAFQAVNGGWKVWALSGLLCLCVTLQSARDV